MSQITDRMIRNYQEAKRERRLNQVVTLINRGKIEVRTNMISGNVESMRRLLATLL